MAHAGSERARLDERTAERVRAHERRMTAAFHDALERSADVLPPGRPTADLASMLTVFMRGLATQIRAGADRAHLEASVSALLDLIRSPSPENP